MYILQYFIEPQIEVIYIACKIFSFLRFLQFLKCISRNKLVCKSRSCITSIQLVLRIFSQLVLKSVILRALGNIPLNVASLFSSTEVTVNEPQSENSLFLKIRPRQFQTLGYMQYVQLEWDVLPYVINLKDVRACCSLIFFILLRITASKQ
ncbi:hypothetical protein SS50377_24797 [Spironucleus salmonicida]|uniref:Uncharacterized protein n=1 Tax=Spironucleus salmonicida TaxID=348837 RepID=V6LLU1_9EUKA|nr:hypothetical protein SS50377_24797 [Spironucleus salmonicida]|eukprot:EST44666.1 Hypothetical protein SS50377_15443 [Spironucleus salmonicida]